MEEQRKTFFKRINVYEEDHDRIKALAEARGITIADYMHRVAIKGKMPEKQTKVKKKK
jgi:hypothetical protein